MRGSMELVQLISRSLTHGVSYWKKVLPNFRPALYMYTSRFVCACKFTFFYIILSSTCDRCDKECEKNWTEELRRSPVSVVSSPLLRGLASPPRRRAKRIVESRRHFLSRSAVCQWYSSDLLSLASKLSFPAVCFSHSLNGRSETSQLQHYPASMHRDRLVFSKP